MPIRLADLANQRRETVIKTDLGNIKVTYRPNALTPSDAARLANAKGDEWVRVLLTQMEDLIVDWDIVGPVYNKTTGEAVVATDEPVPVKKEVLQHVSSDLLGEMFQAVQNDRNPKSPNSPKNSGDIFEGSFA